MGQIIIEPAEGKEANMKPPLSFTVMSTIAIQSGRSQMVVSVLQSGSLAHLQLVQIQPGLCEIGLSKDENQMLIQEQQQLIEKLEVIAEEKLLVAKHKSSFSQKHEGEVLAVVENSRQTAHRRKDEERNKDEVYKAMIESLSEGWSLLLHLLDKRQDVLTLASDFFSRAQEFGACIDRAEELQIKTDDHTLTKIYKSMHRDLLGKSLRLLTTGSVLLQKLRQLQRTEILQRRGGVLQEDGDEQEESSHCSGGMVLKLEQLLETLQDRRRKVDQAVRLQLQQVMENSMMNGQDSSEAELSRKHDANKQCKYATSLQVSGLWSLQGRKCQSREDHTHQTLLTNQIQQLLLSSEQLLDKVWIWVQRGSRVLSHSLKAGWQLSAAEDALNTHLQLRTQSESAGHDVENLRHIMDQITALHTDPTSKTSCHCPSGPNMQLTSLKTLTKLLKQARTSTTWSSSPDADSTKLSLELTSRVDLVLKETQILTRKIDKNLQLLQPYVTFLRAAQQVETELEQLYMYRRIPPKNEEKVVDACWQETLQRIQAARQLGNDFILAVTMVSGSELNLPSLVVGVQQTLERLSRTQQEWNECRTQQQIQIQQLQDNMMYYRKYREKVFKTQQDLKCVSQLLVSCTMMDLGSDVQTSRLLEHLIQARPHFTQLETEVESILKSWENVRRVHEGWKVKEMEGGAPKQEDLSELLKLQMRFRDKIQQIESILELTSSFHLMAKQLEVLLHSIGSTGLCGWGEAELIQQREEQEQILSLFEISSMLKTEICTTVNLSGWTSFSVDQLEARLLSLDSFCSSWLNEAARREEKVSRQLLSQDVKQFLDSFKELKNRFNNMQFNYLKRNDRFRNTKAIRNQQQQVEMYQEKLQGLRKYLQVLMSRLGSDVKERAAAHETGDTINELNRQMGELARSVCEHKKTLDLTCVLQQAMDEYQFWCEEATATIAQVGRFSLECCSTEVVAVLYQQFEKFVWPTVPQQEERLSQMTELAVRLHGLEEGHRYMETMVRNHSQMMESIRKLRDRLMGLQSKVKLEDDREKEIKEEREKPEERDNEAQEKSTKLQQKTTQKEQKDKCSTQESADMHKLKESGHTSELTAEHDGREVPMKSRGQADGAESSVSCARVEANRWAHAFQSTVCPSVLAPWFSEDTGQDMSAGRLTEETQQQVLSENLLSIDEYECVSPDDISLPPLAETPESNLFQSDAEDALCWHSQHHHAHSEHTGTGSAIDAVRQQTESCEKEAGLTPPYSLHSTRFRADSFVQSPLTAPALPPPSMFSSIPGTGETVTLGLPRRDDLLTSGSYPVHWSNTPDGFYHINKKRSCLQTKYAGQYHQPWSNRGPQSENTTTSSMDGNLTKTTMHQDADAMFSLSLPTCRYCPETQLSPGQQDDSQSERDVNHINETSLVWDSLISASTTTPQTIYSSCFHSERLFGPHQDFPLYTGSRNAADDVSDIKMSSSSRCINTQNHQAGFSLHDSLPSASTHQRVHDCDMTSNCSARTTQAWPQQVNLHINPHRHPSSTPHTLTPDTNVCQPMAVREEITVTPQIQGPPLAAPPSPPKVQTESVLQGIAYKHGPPCFTRPLSRATVMEGSPVTLEVEVMGKSMPKLTRLKDEEVSAHALGQVDGNHFLFFSEASDSDGTSCDQWLPAAVDWQTWFGTLCVLLWLLYLILL